MIVAIRSSARIIAAALIAVAWTLAGGGLGAGQVAIAHSVLVRSTPADGSVVTTPLTTLQLVFNEDITPLNAQVLLLDSAGTLHQQSVQVAGPTVTVPVLTDVARGTASIRFRVTSKDGHPITGTVTFRYDAPQASSSASAASTSPTTGSAGPSTLTSGSASVPTPSGGASIAALPAGGSADSGGTATNSGWLYGGAGALAVALIVGGALILRRETRRR